MKPHIFLNNLDLDADGIYSFNFKYQNQDNEVKYKTRCCHNTFHNSCIRQWANKNTSCPMCRKDLSVPLKNETIIKIQNMIINELLQDLINSPEGTELDELVGEHI